MKPPKDKIPDFEDFETRRKAFEKLRDKIEAGDLEAVKFYLEKSTPPRERRIRIGIDRAVWEFLEVLIQKTKTIFQTAAIRKNHKSDANDSNPQH